MSAAGHPRHQPREFIVRVAKGERTENIRVTAQTARDALFRAGMVMAHWQPASEASEWTVRGVRDPAPCDFVPGETA